MLHRGKFIDTVSVRQYNNTAGMLARTSADSRTAHRNSVNLAFALSVAALLIVIPYIAECGLICKCADGSGLESMPLSEENFCILMCLCLIVTGEVQVNIRFFISLESEECLEGDIKSGLNQCFPAVGTYLIRHIESAAAGNAFTSGESNSL